jgi:hypothetical protein
VKTMLTGLGPTQAEINAVSNDPTALSGLVTGWMTTPEYGAKMEDFFANAFQQSQATADGFKSVVDDGQETPNDALLLNFRESFAKTITELLGEGQPFTSAATTTRFMMTTAMMTYFAYADTSIRTDATTSGAGSQINRFLQNDPAWSFSLTASTNIPLADSGNPSSPNYLVFYVPDLADQYGTTQYAAHCSTVDPVVFTSDATFAYGNNSAHWLYNFILGYSFWYFDPPQGQPGSMWCQGGATGTTRAPLLTDADYADWRMVTVGQPTSTATQTRFFDIVGNRASSSLTLYAPRIGYYTTPAFLSQYSTNISNQARATIDQTMIVGLGQMFDGTDPITMQNAPGLDPVHAANPACFACHWNLDPMARFFRSNYSLYFSQQTDAGEIAVPGTFLFDSVVSSVGTLADLGNQIAAHPNFAAAWTQKLCSWANSAPCVEKDPEFVRLAQVFANANYNWSALVQALFTSPIVTYAAPTLTAGTTGTPVPITRRAQFCATLGNRLALGDVCGLDAVEDGAKVSTVPGSAVELPSDGYSRGQVSALYVNDPDPFFSSAVENICALVADMVVDATSDAGVASLYSSANATGAIADMVHGLMGLDSSRDTQPIAILTAHYGAAQAAGESNTLALKSTFELACVSPFVVSIGQ